MNKGKMKERFDKIGKKAQAAFAKLYKGLVLIFTKVLECVTWVVFHVLLPGIPLFLGWFLNRYFIIKSVEGSEIIMKSDILLLGASLATGVIEYAIGSKKKSLLIVIIALVSLLFFCLVYVALFFPTVKFYFKSHDLELEFWTIVQYACVLNIILGIWGDIFTKEKA